METRQVGQKVLLVCGILSSVLWIAADIIASTLLEGYSYFHQTPSELSAIGTPTKTLLVQTGVAYSILLTAFGFGVWLFTHRKHSIRISAGLLIAYGIISFAWFFVPMHPRGTEFTLTDTLHVGMAAVTVLLVLLIIGFGANAFGKRFRIYSIVTLLMLVVFGGLTFLQADRVTADLPTPWMGIYERINVYGYMLWVAVLAIGLLRSRSGSEQ
ncbi:DUF998 domain-containing protein [Fodinibius sediminis]|uniref:DUF998 domain-containing protein n=1 Tax=Fodinibius sediminis TaxID=1214077 RepID=A0A521CY07_9BACT|nr:DUF998 domain-containing protein [Fodinibius sediminis]SMO64346.1 Protein of unknown function [Fodinibius sediminis]